MVRALVAGVGEFPRPYATEEEQAHGRAVFESLPGVREAVDQVAHSLQRVGVALGAPLREPDRDALWDAWRDLRRDAPTGEPLIVLFAGHGTQPPTAGSLYLVCRGGDAAGEFLDDSCVSFAQFLETAENSGRPVLFLLDVCGAGQAVVQQQLLDLLARRPQDAHRNAWVIGACTATHITYGARFTTATARVLDRLADGALDVHPSLMYVPISTLAAAIEGETALADATAGQPGQTLVRTPHSQAVLAPQPFLPNPAYSTDPHARLLSALDAELREFALSCDPGLDPLHFVTRAAGNVHADVIQFSGRTSQLAHIQSWMESTNGAQGRLLIVTGSPGSGKSALLGVATCLTHPDLAPLGRRVRATVHSFRPHPPGIVLAVHARQLTLKQIIDSLGNQLGGQVASGDPATPDTSPVQSGTPDRTVQTPPNTPESLLHRLGAVGDALVIVDALDEAADPVAVLDELLLPLAGAADDGPSTCCRVAIGTRPWWDALPTLHQYLAHHPDSVLNLDPVTEDDRAVLASDVAEYLDKLLGDHYPIQKINHIADQLARYSDSGAFLAAALFASHLLTRKEDVTLEPPRSITEVFDLQGHTLAGTEPWAGPVLAVLGRARGQGMPLDLIHTAALAHAPERAQQPLPPRPQDTRRVLTKAAFYLRTTPDTDQRLLYRYFHQALTDHTLPLTDPASLYTALLNTVPGIQDDTRDWAHARPYVLRHIGAHAIEAGQADSLITDVEFLTHADPSAVWSCLAEARSETARLSATVYRMSASLHRLVNPEFRRQILALDAARCQATLLYQRLISYIWSGDFIPVWATGAHATPALLNTLRHDGWSHGLDFFTLEGTPVALTADSYGFLHIWNLKTGSYHCKPWKVVFPELVTRLACTVVDGVPVLIVAAGGAPPQIWNLRSRTLWGEPLSDYRLENIEEREKRVWAIACTELDGTPVAITGGYSDGTLRIWNLRNQQLIGPPLTGHESRVNALACIEVEGAPAVVSASDDGTARLWGLRTHHQVGEPLESHSGPVKAVACTMLDGAPIAVTGGADGSLKRWNLASNEAINLSVTPNPIQCLACSTLDQHPIVVSGDRKGIVMTHDVATGQQAIHPLVGHTDEVSEISCAVVGDSPIALSRSQNLIHVWNLASKEILKASRIGHTGNVKSISHAAINAEPVAATVADDSTLQMWRVVDGEFVRGWRIAEEQAPNVVHCLNRAGIPLAITGHTDGLVRVWNLDERDVREESIAALPGPISLVSSMVVANHTIVVAATYEGAITAVDLDSRSPIGPVIPGGDIWTATVGCVVRDDTPVAVIISDGTAQIWNLITGKAVGAPLDEDVGSAHEVSCAVVDGTPVAVTGHESVLRVWNLHNGSQFGEPLVGHVDFIRHISCSESPGATMAVSTSEDETARIWDLRSQRCVGVVGAPGINVALLAPQGQLLAGIGNDLAMYIRKERNRDIPQQ